MTSTSASSQQTPPIMVQVAAPATLSEGFQFDATFDGKQFTVTVPKGGVTQGQMFEVPFVVSSTKTATTASSSATGGNSSNSGYPSTYQSGTNAGGGGYGGGTGTTGTGTDGTFHSTSDEHNILENESTDPHHIPRGQWRDGLFDCCILGPFHPSLIMAIFCHTCLNGQIMTRLRLNWLGEVSTSSFGTQEHNHWQHWTNTYKNVVYIVCIYLFLTNFIFNIPSPKYETIIVNEETGESMLQNVTPPPSRLTIMMNNILNISMASYTVITMIRARRYIRHKYHIPEHHLVANTAFANLGIEDCMLSLFCSCCTVSQMARHTADYRHGGVNHAMFCTSNGLSIPENMTDDDENNNNNSLNAVGSSSSGYPTHSTMVV